MKNIVLKPRLSEKAYGVSQDGNVYVFVVPMAANKHTVARAVAAQYGVEVNAVNITVSKGKVVRSYRKRSRATAGQRTDFKKAYVTVAKGASLPIFESEEASNKDSKEKKKTTKAKETK